MKIRLEEVRFIQIVRDVESLGRNSITRVSGVPELIFTKLTLAHLFVKNSYTELHENPTNSLVADVRLRKKGRTDG